MADASAYLPLLRMATSISTPREEGAPPAAPMDPERAKWLKEALAASLVNPVDEMKKILAAVQAADATDQAVAENLERLVGFAENIDLARDLHKIGGLRVVVDLAQNGRTSETRAAAAHVLGAAVQNNEPVQNWALELGALDAIQCLLTREDASHTERAKGVFSASSLVRQHDMATVKFVKDHKGFALLVKVLEDPHPDALPTRRKALFLMAYLLRRAPPTVRASHATVVPAVVATLERDKQDADLRDKALAVLVCYGEDSVVRDAHGGVVRRAVLSVDEYVKTLDDEDRDAILQALAVWNPAEAKANASASVSASASASA